MSLNLEILETQVGARRRPIINLTKHPIKFTRNGRDILVARPCGIYVGANRIDSLYGTQDDVRLKKSIFVPTTEGEELITQIQREYPGAVLVGATLQFQSYSRIWGMRPFPSKDTGETVRLMQLDEFSVSAGRCAYCGHWADEKNQAVPS